MWPSLKPSQREAIVGVIPPQSASTVQTTAWCDASQFENFEGLIMVGALGASATVDALLQQAQDSTGTGVKTVTGSAIVQLTKAAANDNSECRINFMQADLDVANAFCFIRLAITPAVAASLISGVLQGVDPRYGPADGYAAASQTQIIS
jgi:hypothetical protein